MSAALAFAACLPAVEDDPPPVVMCESTLDCDHDNGEICADNICWGNPPDDVVFGAKLEPPEDYPELVPTEVPIISISDDGTVDGLEFSDHVTLSGRVLLACDDNGDPSICDPNSSIAAQISVRRPSAIPGAPAYEIGVIATDGVAPGTAAFTLRVPPTLEGEPPYEVTITPDAGNLASTPYLGATPAEMAPPIRFSIEATSDVTGIEWVLGEPDEHRVVTGRVVDAAMRGMENMQVWAFGTWTQSSEVERGSSLGTTDTDGYFTLRIPTAMQDTFDLVARPEAGNPVPTLRARDVYIPDPEDNEPDGVFVVPDMRMPSHAGAVTFNIPIKGFDINGELAPVPGADVRFTTVLLDDGEVRAHYESQAFSDVNGDVTVQLIPGGLTQTRTYVVRVSPPPSSVYASLFDVEISVPAGGVEWLEQIMVERRIAVRGHLVNNFGKALPNTAVVARAGLSFVSALENTAQTMLEDMQFPNTVTDENGDFVVWVDRQLAGAPAAYDFDFTPPPGSSAPWWSEHNVSTEDVNNLGVVDLETVTLPAASYARGPIHTPLGDLVKGAEVRLFELSDEELVCGVNTGDDCVPGAILRGLWQSREDGWVWMVLPEP